MTNLSHALAVINLYFSLKPVRWMYEPREPFEHLGQKYEWRPDCMFDYKGILYACEVQRSYPPGKNPWPRKWEIYNLYFMYGYYKNAAYQKWAKSIIAPQFLVITKQNPETVRAGFEVEGRDLIVVREWK
ncbi:hypothetical protein [Paenibacillus sp. HJGM_3]|uniref:hypothetical protein n=1 Tax=Paenibacillus sp. HJGM_3 TaxID=3379816 RepID=UPI0038597884